MKDERVIELWTLACERERNGVYRDILMRFAELVAAETREEGAKSCDEMAACAESVRHDVPAGEGMRRAYVNAAAVIRGYKS